ncbi:MULTISPECIES: hypothetical protein [Leptospira]|uniref:ACT domain-containing protein n=5 Tax=Leptospira borgpetersenii TaxID=174 RepID=M3FIM7_LEPBO|nr:MULTISPECIES: hypothetical protein [Leptospira]EMG01673.1 hypothetical protein LEP1GSC123_3499 [Leptospira borgpetersenii str. 200701203]EMO10182.1 hypothetical protein LEP1GSC137_1660 [Leptospira borgpetersenii str. Noumea 25]ALO25325.1 hypothetical protein LBBP_01014 [Leptospira borgpetersenii serovar Ballum]ANH00270.1 Uncharacterized protein LB4E_0809 [Leptospira borgpetersenii str. 4E]AXX15694.1 hypothetical protein C4Q31_09175 [Leptospira borgpetersenii serovar Ceylonica]
MIQISAESSIHVSCIPRDGSYALKVNVSNNEIGIIYRVTATLFARGWTIEEAVAETSQDGYISDIFIIKSVENFPMTEEALHVIQTDLREMFFQGVSVLNYLERFPNKMEYLQDKEKHPVELSLFNSQGSDCTVMDLKMKDRPGIIFEVSQLLFLYGIDILSFKAMTNSDSVRDTFLLRLENGDKLDEFLHFERLVTALKTIL